jgi:hypothetical protein
MLRVYAAAARTMPMFAVKLRMRRNDNEGCMSSARRSTVRIIGVCCVAVSLCRCVAVSQCRLDWPIPGLRGTQHDEHAGLLACGVRCGYGRRVGGLK